MRGGGGGKGKGEREAKFQQWESITKIIIKIKT